MSHVSHAAASARILAASEAGRPIDVAAPLRPWRSMIAERSL
jgi:hypothetical protein